MGNPRRIRVEEPAPDSPEPSAESILSSAAQRSRFEQTLAQTHVLRRLRGRASEVFQSKAPTDYSGLQDLLVSVLPPDYAERAQIADAVHLHPITLEDLLSGEILSTDLDAERLVMLCHWIGLDPVGMLRLVEQDYERHPNPLSGREALGELRRAWKDFEVK